MFNLSDLIEELRRMRQTTEKFIEKLDYLEKRLGGLEKIADKIEMYGDMAEKAYNVLVDIREELRKLNRRK